MVGGTPKSCEPTWVRSSFSYTSHSEVILPVPNDDNGVGFPFSMNAFRTRVLSLVPAETPATSQPEPGSSSDVPNISIIVESVPSI